jgi:hypothetical protein
MKIALPPSSLLNFLAGIFASAGINLLTSVATGPEADVSTAKIAIDSCCWVVAAAFLTWAAQVIRRSERSTDVAAVNGLLSGEEKEEQRDAIREQTWRKARLPIALTVVSVIGSVILLPRLIHWGGLL